MNRPFLSLFFSTLIAVIPATSFSAMSLQDANTLGKNLGEQNRNEVGTSGISEETASQVPFYKKNPVQENGYQGGFGDMMNIGVSRITQSQQYSPGRCDREGFDPAAEAQKSVGPEKWAAMTPLQRQKAIQDQSDYFDQECEGINFLAGDYQMRDKITIPPGDDLQNWTPPAGSPDDSSCSTQTVTTPAEYRTDSCYESMTLEKRFCNESLNVVCRPPPEGNCASGGIVRGSVSVNTGGYSYSFSGSQLILKNTIHAPWSLTYAKFSFKLEGLDRIQEFRAVQITSDNWVGIEINGTYLGTHTRYFGGFSRSNYKIRVSGSQVCWSATSCRSAETGDSFTSSVSVDMMPYLVEGDNYITMYVVDGGPPGNGTIWINAKQKCLPDCDFNWVNTCAAFDSGVAR